MSLRPTEDLVALYLSDFYPEGPWVLTAIHTDRSGTITKTFSPDTVEQMKEWVVTHNVDHHNLYYHVGIPKRELNRKAGRDDIDAVLWLHVDIDPPTGIDIEISRQQALSMLENGKDGIPPPTVVVNSGGGVQAFWRLNERIVIGGDVAKAEKAKSHNQRLEVVFGADNCHNIDRIMRLPGTVNWPNARKRRKGREPKLATVEYFKKDRSYDLVRFPPLQTTQSMTSNVEGTDLELSSHVERVDVDDLDKWEVADRVKVICVQGMHPDEIKDGDDSRSAWLFDALVRLVKCKVPDQVIYSIVTDPDMGISESVLEKSDSDRYARRQIARAKQHAIDPQLLEMNERHAVIRNWGGKCCVIEEVMDDSMDRSRLTRISFGDFRNGYCHRQVEVGKTNDGEPKYRPLGDWWIKNPQRRQYSKLTFAPGKETPGSYNLWRGFGVQSAAGDCRMFLDHLKQNLCDSNDEYFQYLTHWMARAVQFPGRPGEVAIVLRGDQGTGKSFFAKEFGSLFGRHFLTVSDPKHLVGSFNSHLRDVVLLFGDEAFFAGDKKHESVLKTLVTDDQINIESKGIDVEVSRNFTHLILASNSDWVVPAGSSERRFFCLDVQSHKKQDSDYFKRLSDHMLTGGREALLHYLLALNLKEWNVRKVPQTDALASQKVLSLPPMEEWWFSKLDNGRLCDDENFWADSILCDALIQDYIRYTQAFNISRRGNATQLGRFLRRLVPSLNRTQRVVACEDDMGEMKRQRAYVWQFPPLDVCRELWEKKYGRTPWAIALPHSGEDY
jgi:hypothetical protein